MKLKSYLLIVCIGLGTLVFGQSPHFLWAKKYGLIGKNEAVMGSGIDGSGNLYLAGRYYDSTSFDGQQLMQGPAGDSLGVFVAKLNEQGAIIWVNSYRSARPITHTVLTVQDNGISYLAGRFIGDLTIGTFNLNSGANDPQGGSIFLAKFAADGTVSWAIKFEAKDAKSMDIELDNNGNILMTGSYKGSINFGGGKVLNGQPATAMNCFIARFDPFNGVADWAVQARSNNLGEGESLISGPDGAIYVGGIFVDTLEFSPSVKFVSVEPDVNSPENAFVSKYDMNGNFVWAKQITGLINARVFLTFCNQNVYAAVSTLMTFGYASESATYGNYLIKIDKTNGNKVWMKKTSLRFYGLESDGDSAIYYMNMGSLNYYFDSYSTTTGSGELALGKLDANGVFKWVEMRGDAVFPLVGFKAKNKKVFMGGSMMGFGTTEFETGISLHTGEFWSQDAWYALFNDTGESILPNALTPVEGDHLGFTLYPNPGSGPIQLHCKDIPANSQVFIMDMQGKVVHQQAVTQETQNMDLSNLKGGVYLVKLAHQNGTQTQRLVLY
ncbi:MAG TPA: hypothetical protein DIW47_15960 [Bacteroidetes bacterium]|nr:hypothetical protein [Bacteroidota bacterium]